MYICSLLIFKTDLYNIVCFNKKKTIKKLFIYSLQNNYIIKCHQIKKNEYSYFYSSNEEIRYTYIYVTSIDKAVVIFFAIG